METAETHQQQRQTVNLFRH